MQPAILRSIHTLLQSSYFTQYSNHFYPTQCNSLHFRISWIFNFVAVPQCNSCCKDGSSSTATSHNKEEVEYEQVLRHNILHKTLADTSIALFQLYLITLPQFQFPWHIISKSTLISIFFIILYIFYIKIQYIIYFSISVLMHT